MRLTMEFEQEPDGRWIAEVPQLPGVMAYGDSVHAAIAKAHLALRVLTEQIELVRQSPFPLRSTFRWRHGPMAGVRSEARSGSLLAIGWRIKRQTGSHRTLSRAGWPNVVFAFHDSEESGPAALSRIGKRTGLRPEDL